ncbi:IS3 family transposase [Virgibacillus halophilus]|uniref:IS3 family transposase n=1 Tax=Tigheibacillus halophilus TaxID=361280 RepID=A0ABU5C4Y6_9BACI|nr:IS3 family transposase [Virgibacillus halophilus]MDY0394388.1 IS3 family transposase [Virgibacillus halophilus]MDY0395452.1 IS3 family transposase [Virgibacillus halophilus]MDY0395593.1 IS3 family transposase [Virgibacillus halophilus]
MAFELKEEGFRLKDVLLVVGIPEATYHYHVKRFDKEDSDIALKELITDLFKKFHERYGYKRITKELKKLGHEINHKKSVPDNAGIRFKMCEIYAEIP